METCECVFTYSWYENHTIEDTNENNALFQLFRFSKCILLFPCCSCRYYCTTQDPLHQLWTMKEKYPYHSQCYFMNGNEDSDNQLDLSHMFKHEWKIKPSAWLGNQGPKHYTMSYSKLPSFKFAPQKTVGSQVERSFNLVKEALPKSVTIEEKWPSSPLLSLFLETKLTTKITFRLSLILSSGPLDPPPQIFKKWIKLENKY